MACLNDLVVSGHHIQNIKHQRRYIIGVFSDSLKRLKRCTSTKRIELDRRSVGLVSFIECDKHINTDLHVHEKTITLDNVR